MNNCILLVLVLGLLFVRYVNDLDVNVGGMISYISIDDTKVGGGVDSEESCPRLQQASNWMESWVA